MLEPEDEIEEREMLRQEILRLNEALESSKLDYQLLASEMVYEGNSVQYWRDKAIAYKKAVGEKYYEINRLRNQLGIKQCCECGKDVQDAVAHKNGHTGFCSHECFGRCIGMGCSNSAGEFTW